MAASVIDILHSLGLSESSELYALLDKLEDYNLVTTEEIRNIKNISVKPLPNIVRNQADALKQRMYGVATDEDYGLPFVINRRMVLVRYILENLKYRVDDLDENLSSWIDTIVYETENGVFISRYAQKDAKNNIIDETYETKEDANQKQQTVEQTINSTKEELKQYTNNQTNALEQSTQTKLNSKAEKKEIPTKVSQLENDADYVTLEKLNDTKDELREYADDKVANLVNSAPTTLDTLKELSTALGNDPNFATTIATQIGNKANKEEVPTKLSDLEIDIEVGGGVSEEEVLGIIEDNSVQAQAISIGESTSFDSTSDNQIPTSKAVKGYVDSVLGDIETLLGGI